MSEIPEELDWVAERDKCVAFHAFKQLQSDIEKDIVIRNKFVTDAQNQNHVAFVLKPDEQDKDIFRVHRNGAGIHSVVLFKLDGERIVVQDDKNQTLATATLTIDDGGKCSLRVGGYQLTRWQFRRRVLEGLLYVF